MQQLSFSTLFGSPDARTTKESSPFKTWEEAKAARDAAWRQFKKEGRKANRWVLKGQVRGWWEFGVPCGQMCDVYMIDLWD